MNKSVLSLIFPVILLLLSVQVQAVESGYRNIMSFGCHLVDGTCYIGIEGPAVGPAECLDTSVRFNVQDSPNGKTWLSLIQVAYVSGRRINLNIHGCYVSQPSFPTFTHGSVEK